MVNRRLDISQFNAVGVYVVEIDASVPPIEIDTQRTRIIVGFSRKGVKNTMVYLTSKRDAVNIFGDIDPYLEKRGSFFHRSLLTALETGPVFALNLLPVDNNPITGDKVEFLSYSLDTNNSNGVKNEQGTKLNTLYSTFFDKQRFWKADEESFQGITNMFELSKGKYFSIVNLSDSPITILTKKSNKAPRDFNITVSEYYGKGKEPLITKPFDLMSDYFIDVTLISGTWDNFDMLAADPIYGAYFDNNGLRSDRASSFLSSDGISIIANYTGCILPEVLDNSGSNVSINTVVNRDFLRTHTFCTLNEKAIEDYDSMISENHIDLIGHNLVTGKVNKVDFLSYNEFINNTLEVVKNTEIFDNKIEGVGNITNDLGYDIFNLTTNKQGEYTNLNIDQLKLTLDLEIENGDVYVDLGSDIWVYGKNINGDVTGVIGKNKRFINGTKLTETSFQLTKEGSNYNLVYNTNTLQAFNPDVLNKTWFNTTNSANVNNLYLYDGNTTLSKLTFTEAIVVSSPVADSSTEYTITFTNVSLNGLPLTNNTYNVVLDPKSVGNVTVYQNRTQTDILENNGTNLLLVGSSSEYYDQINELVKYPNNTYIINNSGKEYSFVISKDLDNTLIISDELSIENQGTPLSFINNVLNILYTKGKKISKEYTINRVITNDTIIVSKEVGETINVGDFLVGIYNNESVLTSVRNKVRLIDADGIIEYELSTILPLTILNNKITKYEKIDEFVTHYNIHSLKGFSFTKYHLPDGTDSQVNKIYNVIEDTNLYEILADRNILDWRYIIDTFDGGIAPNMGSKSVLSRLAMNKKQGIALLNAPSIKRFMDSSNPFFCEQPTLLNPKPILNTDFIKSGGNLMLGPTNRFSIPNEENGGKYCGVFGPFLSITENNKRKTIPPAADISNNYMRKFRLGQPYAIVAGEPLGIIGNANLSGVEFDLLDRDRANFEAIGINPIVFRDGVTKIFANLTGYQRVVSPLNSLHVRDLLISIENTLINITSKYLFRKNTPTVRLEIQTIVENYLEGVMTDGGIDWFNVTIDSSNNTSDIIDQRIALLDIEVQPSLGIEKFVNRITIYGAGGATGSGF
jgi:hypothetical protein